MDDLTPTPTFNHYLLEHPGSWVECNLCLPESIPVSPLEEEPPPWSFMEEEEVTEEQTTKAKINKCPYHPDRTLKVRVHYDFSRVYEIDTIDRIYHEPGEDFHLMVQVDAKDESVSGYINQLLHEMPAESAVLFCSKIGCTFRTGWGDNEDKIIFDVGYITDTDE